MALTGITVSNNDHFAKGGVKSIELFEVFDSTNTNNLQFDVHASDHQVTGFSSNGNGAYIEFEKETAKMTISSTQEKGLPMKTVSIEAYIPEISESKLSALQGLEGKALAARVDLWDKKGANHKSFLVGWDNVLGSTSTIATINYHHSKFALFIDSIEGDSGAGLSEQNGITLKMTCVQGEYPRDIVLT
jgi:hypothetical protein